MKNSKIILCKNIKMDKNYFNVLDYTETDMIALCESNKINEANNYSFLKPNGNTIEVAFTYSECLEANYMAFQNPYYNNKWFFAFVDSVEYRNDFLTRITFTIDVFSTWFKKLTLSTCFVEREHVNNDTIGLHTIPENIEIGDYVSTGNATTLPVYHNVKYCLAVSKLPDNKPVGASEVGGIISGLAYLFTDDLTNFKGLKAFYETGLADSMKSIFYFDGAFIENAIEGFISLDNVQYKYYRITDTSSISKAMPYIPKASNLNGYYPTNKKLLTYPYCYLQIDNNNGYSSVYKYEDFTTEKCVFSCEIAFTVGGSTRLSPLNYKGRANNYLESFQAGKLPVGNFGSDEYANWLSRNGNNIALNVLGGVGQLASVGLATSPTTSAINLATVGLLTGVGSTMNQVYESSLISPAIQGNLSNGDVNYLLGLYNPIAYNKTIKSEYAKSIDNFWNLYGYKVNEVKIPNIKGRQNWNFVKTIGCNFVGPLNATDLATIQSIFDKGVTIWHSHDNMLNYNLSNNIVTD